LANSSISNTFLNVQKEEINYPLIVKPDIGFRGLLVQIINSENELESYLKKYTINIIIQEFINYKNECGIFYYRNPNQEKGVISSITLKKFLIVFGDGISTLKHLILADNRAKLYVDLLTKIHENKINLIPKKNEKILLSVIGNHSKGTQFLNGNHLISKKLEATFDALNKRIPGWFYGRIDIKYNDFTDVENGSDFKILEINGIIAEPTHIYDAQNSSYFKALKAIRTHWKSLYEVSIANHNQYKIPYKSSRKFIAEMFELRAYTKKIKKFTP
jgi:hypothetical protein